ncbi:BTAD domain-containing putative transcriptional regulator [Streptomyces xiamenensis]|uniref:AfsR/SARP family transcriptional regulator n=1 Tax=Streptomyces xiamenensis TaxID=408015 RepID=UPI003D727BCF
MRFQLLGPLSMTDGTDTVVLGPSKPTNLLAALLLRSNSIVSAGYLQQMIWGDEQPATAKAALQTCVLRLRRLFERQHVLDTPIEAAPGGYRITADERTLDLIEFRARVRHGTALADDPAAELSTLRHALTLWQGSLLANVRSETMHRDEVPRLVEERLRTVERVCDLELTLGNCGAALVELWSATRAHPSHGRFREQLIEALYRTGRQSEALSEYRGFKEYLRDELGVDPSPALQKLELAILRGESLGPAPESGHTPALPPAPLPAALPAPAAPAVLLAPGPPPDPSPSACAAAPPAWTPVPSFTGRATEVAALVARLTTRPGTELLCGAPGIGKTALARHVADLVRDHFPGGCRVIDMAERGESAGTGTGAGDVPERIDADPRTLLVLDDVKDPGHVHALLSARRGAATLITSRRGLAALVATHGGRVTRLDLFTAAEAHTLLRAALGTERVAAESGAAAELALLCGRHPLALRIAAARLLTRPALRIADAVGWLTDDPLTRLALPDDPRLSVPRVLDGALERLAPPLPAVFAALGRLGRDRFHPADAATAVGAAVTSPLTPSETETALERLADAGLLEDGPPGPYRMHPLLRGYARTRYPDRDPQKV